MAARQRMETAVKALGEHVPVCMCTGDRQKGYFH